MKRLKSPTKVNERPYEYGHVVFEAWKSEYKLEVNGVGLWPKTRSKRCQVIGLEGCDQLRRIQNGPKSLDMEVMRVHFITFLLEN